MSPRRAPSISLVIPIYNEEENLEHAVTCAAEALALQPGAWEIIAVDDGSTDDSAAILARLAAAEPRLRVVRHAVNRSLGAALRSGFAAATGDLVLYMDADLPFDPRDLLRAVHALEVTRADMIAGYRLDRTTEGWRRAVLSYVYNLLIGVLFGWPHRDINFSFKLVRRRVLEAVELRAEGSLIDAELVVKARNLGFVIQQLGLDYFPRTRGRSTLSSPRVILRILRELVRLYPEMRRPRRRATAAGAGVAAGTTDAPPDEPAAAVPPDPADAAAAGTAPA
jgi:glycosyltransferase involved in cell wall biosynthesis